MPADGGWASCRPPIPGRWSWRCGRCSARAAGGHRLAHASFSETWANDVVNLQARRCAGCWKAPYGRLPDLAQLDPRTISCWPGTARFRRALPRWRFHPRPIAKGLVICDATSAAFAMDAAMGETRCRHLVLAESAGGEAAHGTLALSPRAVGTIAEPISRPGPCRRFSAFPPRQAPRAFSRGETIHTPSMLCVEDALDGLRWAESIGGLPGLIGRCEANLAAVAGLGGGAATGRISWPRFRRRAPAPRFV